MDRNGFKPHDNGSAGPAMAVAAEKFGFVPNLLRYMAESPATLQGYLALSSTFHHSSLPAPDCLLAELASSVENGCRYCIGAHSAQALQAGVDPKVAAAIRAQKPVAEARTAALLRMVRALIAARGAVPEAEVSAFLAAGFTRAQLLEVVMGIALKTISNYTNHLVDARSDKAHPARAAES